MPTTKAKNTKSNVVDRISSIFLYKDRLLKRCDKLLMEKPPYHGYYIVKIWEVQFFIRGKKTKSRFLNTQKPFFEHEIMQNAIWNMEKLKKV